MKKLSFYLFALSVGILVFSSCGKYEEGPDFSLRTKKARLSGTWINESTSIYAQEEEEGEGENTDTWMKETLDSISQQRYIFTKDGEGSLFLPDYSIDSLSMVEFENEFDIEWKLSADKTELLYRAKLGNTDWGTWQTHTILKLTNSELWLLKDSHITGVQIEHKYIKE